MVHGDFGSFRSATDCPSALRFCLHLDVSWARVTTFVFEICPLGYAGLLFLSERFHWTSQCGHKHYLLSAPGLPPELKTKPLLTDPSFLSCWKVRAADAVCYWKEALCVPLCKWRCLSASLWCLYFAHREAGGPCQNPSPSVGPDPLGASLFSSLCNYFLTCGIFIINQYKMFLRFVHIAAHITISLLFKTE